MADRYAPGVPESHRRAPTVGHERRGGNKQIAIRFDPETFAQIEALAVRDRVSFAEKVRQLVEWGLEA
jgi:hypothetical protein